MAEPVLLKDCTFWLGGYDIRTSLNRVNLTAAKAELPNARFGDIADVVHPGLQQITLTAGGFFSSDAIATSQEPDTIIWPRIDPTVTPSEWPIVVGPPNAPSVPNTDYNTVFVLRSKQFAYTLGASHGELSPYELVSRCAAGGLYQGRIMLPKATYAATTTGTARNLGALSATQKIVATLHVFAVTGGTWTLTVESDTVGFPSPLVRATFTGATGITTQVIETNGAITDDWWRVVLTKSGGTSCVASATLAIAPQ